MGKLLNKKTSYNGVEPRKKLSKGQRLGWVHISEYEPVSLRSLPSQGQTLMPYVTGPFSLNKLVP